MQRRLKSHKTNFLELFGKNPLQPKANATVAFIDYWERHPSNLFTATALMETIFLKRIANPHNDHEIQSWSGSWLYVFQDWPQDGSSRSSSA